MHDRTGLAALVAVLSLANLSLLSTYNIFVGDDGYLASYLYGYYFTGSRDFILCQNWPIHQFLVLTLGAAYRWSYATQIGLIEKLGLPYHYLNALSATSFVATLATFAATISSVQRRWIVLACVLTMGTLEPMLVMSHSIRTEALVVLALSIAVLGLVKCEGTIKSFVLLTLATVAIINLHLGGWPLIVGLGLGVTYLHGVRGAAAYAMGCAAAGLSYLALNELLSAQALKDLFRLYSAQGSISGFSRAHVLDDVISHFIEAKYMRNVIELIIVAAFLACCTRWADLSRKSRALIVTTVGSCLSYVLIFSYINPYYLVYLYYLMMVSIAWCGGETLSERASKWIAISISAPFAVLFIIIFAMFARAPGWTLLDANTVKLLQALPEQGLIAAPEYFAHIDPKNRRLFVPLSQAKPEDRCVKDDISTPNDFTAIVIDTRRLEVSAPLLAGFQLVERIRIGRLASQSMSDEGELRVYVRK